MEAREQLAEQDNCCHWHHQREHQAECCVPLRQTAGYCCEASCFVLGDSLKGVEIPMIVGMNGIQANVIPHNHFFLVSWPRLLSIGPERLPHVSDEKQGSGQFRHMQDP